MIYSKNFLWCFNPTTNVLQYILERLAHAKRPHLSMKVVHISAGFYKTFCKHLKTWPVEPPYEEIQHPFETYGPLQKAVECSNTKVAFCTHGSAFICLQSMYQYLDMLLFVYPRLRFAFSLSTSSFFNDLVEISSSTLCHKKKKSSNSPKAKENVTQTLRSQRPSDGQNFKEEKTIYLILYLASDEDVAIDSSPAPSKWTAYLASFQWPQDTPA